MRLLFSFLIFLLLVIYPQKSQAIYGNYDEFSPTYIEKPPVQKKISKGSIVRGFISQTVSSEFNNSGDLIKVLITSDYILNDEILIPKNALFIGEIKNLQKAQRGMDGYFSIDILGLVFPDGSKYNVKGYIPSAKKSRVFGGGFTKRVGHKTTVHRGTKVGNKGVLYLQQNGPRIMGEETKIKMGDFVTIIIEEELILD